MFLTLFRFAFVPHALSAFLENTPASDKKTKQTNLLKM